MSAVDGEILHSLDDEIGDVSPTGRFYTSSSLHEIDLVNLPPMTFKAGRRADDSSDSGSSDVDSDEEIDGRNKPLPAPPGSSTLSPPKSVARLEFSSPPNISHIPNFSTSTVSSYTTASSTSSVPVTPITPNTPVTPFLSTSSVFPSTTSLSRSSSLSRTQSPNVPHFHSGPGTRSRQPSVVSLAGGYHLPTIVAGKASPTIGHKPSLPLLSDTDNDTDINADVDTEVDGYFRNIGAETSRPAARLTRQPSLGSRPGLEFRAPPGSGMFSSSNSELPSAGVMRRYASAGNLLSHSSSRPGSSNSGHQHSYSHPTPFPTASMSPASYSSTPSSLPESSLDAPAVITSTRSRADSSAAQTGNSRNRSRAGSTILRNAVYIEALDSNEVERRLLSLSPVIDRDHVVDEYHEISDSEQEVENTDFEHSKWSPASSMIDLRSPGPKILTDSSSSFGWGFPKIIGVQAPPPTPSTPFPASRSGSFIDMADPGVMKSPIVEEAPKKSYLSMNVSKRKSLNTASTSSAPVPPSPSQSDLSNSEVNHNMSAPPATPGKRQRLASFITKMAGYTSSQVPPVPLSPSSSSPETLSNTAPSSPSSPSSPNKFHSRPAPLDLSLKPKTSSATDSHTITGTSEPSTPAFTSGSSWREDSGSETEMEDEDMDPDLIAVAAGLDLPSPPASPRTPRAIPAAPSGRPLSYQRGNDFPSTPTGLDDDAQMVRGSYAQVYGFRSPKATSSPLASHSLTYLPTIHSPESSVPRGATPTLVGSQSLISPGDLPPSGGSPKTSRIRKISTSTLTATFTLPQSTSSPPRPSPSTPPRPSLKSPSKSPKTKGGRMSGFISRFTLGSSTSLAVSPLSVSSDSVPPVPPLKVDELGQIVPDPFAKADLTTADMPNPDRSLSAADSIMQSFFVSPDTLSGEINGERLFTRRERSGTTATASSAFSSSTTDSTSSPERQSVTKKKRRSLGLTLGTVTLGNISGMRSPIKSTNRGRKRKLVISGVGLNDTRAYQAVKNWCEDFGELRKFERQDNGNLIVDWRSRTVGDMVCRVQANVFIKGAGSVALSWIQS